MVKASWQLRGVAKHVAVGGSVAMRALQSSIGDGRLLGGIWVTPVGCAAVGSCLRAAARVVVAVLSLKSGTIIKSSLKVCQD